MKKLSKNKNIKHNLCVILGTRPEIIKLYKIIGFLKNKKKISCTILYTNQHEHLGKEFSNIFKLKFDNKIKIKNNQKISFEYVGKIFQFLKQKKIQSVVVMGDTMSAAVGAIAAYLNKSKIFYVESGLRTGDFNQPWPEEGFRKIITHISNFHFAPTLINKKNLITEGIERKSIFLSGNPVIDAIKESLSYINRNSVRDKIDNEIERQVNFKHKKFILITIHRRENFGKPFEKICKNINRVSKKYKHLKFVYPVHPNPYIKKNAFKLFKKNKNVLLIKPADYFTFLRLMQLCKFIISDSGGIQEECTVVNKYVLLVRNKTERPEIKNKLVFAVGSDYNKFEKYFSLFLNSVPKKNKFLKTFGNGFSSEKIGKIILKKCI